MDLNKVRKQILRDVRVSCEIDVLLVPIQENSDGVT